MSKEYLTQSLIFDIFSANLWALVDRARPVSSQILDSIGNQFSGLMSRREIKV